MNLSPMGVGLSVECMRIVGPVNPPEVPLTECRDIYKSLQALGDSKRSPGAINDSFQFLT